VTTRPVVKVARGIGPRWRRWRRIRRTPTGWRLMLRYENDGAPGTCFLNSEYVRFNTNGRWDLVIVTDDIMPRTRDSFDCGRYSSRWLVSWAKEQDAEDFEWQLEKARRRGMPHPSEAPALGPRLQRLRRIARFYRARTALRYIEGIEAGTWPPPPKPPRIRAVVGVIERPVWRGTWHATYGVITEHGLGYLYPPGEDGTSTLILQGAGSRFTLNPTRKLSRALLEHAGALERLSAAIKSRSSLRVRSSGRPWGPPPDGLVGVDMPVGRETRDVRGIVVTSGKPSCACVTTGTGGKSMSGPEERAAKPLEVSRADQSPDPVSSPSPPTPTTTPPTGPSLVAPTGTLRVFTPEEARDFFGSFAIGRMRFPRHPSDTCSDDTDGD